MKEVRAGLFIGDATDSEIALSPTDHGITHLLSLVSFLPASHGVPTSEHITTEGVRWKPLPHLTRLWLPWDDTAEQNILDSLNICFDFIDEGLQHGQVLVHCLAGISRSAAVVIGYLMRLEHLSLEDASSSLRSVSSTASPNKGFLDQLRLFEYMGFNVDKTSMIYKKFHLEKLGELYGLGKIVEGSQFAEDPALNVPINTAAVRYSLLYRCKKCRRIVASGENVLSHEQQGGHFHVRKRGMDTLSDNSGSVQCTSIFVEPMRWMTAVQEGGVLGKLSCAGCNVRLGSFNWAGTQCSCGTWVVPAFQLHKSRMDASKF